MCYTPNSKARFTYTYAGIPALRAGVQSKLFKGGGPVTNRIAELRKARKISQAELADGVDVTRQTIISLENGRYNASLLLAHKIAKYFGMTIEEVFLFEEEIP